jgi:membrane protease YdiL (CAAX protease family)
MIDRKPFTERHPYVFALILLAGIITVFIWAGISIGVINFFLKLPIDSLVVYVVLVSYAALAAIASILLTRMGWWRAIGFRKPRRLRDLWLFLLIALPVLGNLSEGIKSTAVPDIGMFFVIALLVGFVEEAFFRGLMLRPIVSQGVWRAAIVTSAVFGLLHIPVINVISGSDQLALLLQVGFPVALGFVYAALVLRTGMIWPLMLGHFLTDFFAFIGMNQLAPMSPIQISAGDLIIGGIYIVAFIGYGVWLLARPQYRTTV